MAGPAVSRRDRLAGGRHRQGGRRQERRGRRAGPRAPRGGPAGAAAGSRPAREPPRADRRAAHGRGTHRDRTGPVPAEPLPAPDHRRDRARPPARRVAGEARVGEPGVPPLRRRGPRHQGAVDPRARPAAGARLRPRARRADRHRRARRSRDRPRAGAADRAAGHVGRDRLGALRADGQRAGGPGPRSPGVRDRRRHPGRGDAGPGGAGTAGADRAAPRRGRRTSCWSTGSTRRRRGRATATRSWSCGGSAAPSTSGSWRVSPRGGRGRASRCRSCRWPADRR